MGSIYSEKFRTLDFGPYLPHCLVNNLITMSIEYWRLCMYRSYIIIKAKLE